ncbi:receptor-type tyrosine-protein phosphatase F-like isoform X3 [Montipora foliosa]|uniref:receptor-type tyrosine-protein phosphatase F-like isoform X3 n=1 Tax=Montipora foliosa TaxID=591990 RepID=UPI0035F17788
MAFFVRKSYYLWTSLILVINILSQETGTQASSKVPSSDPVIVKGQNGTKAEDAHTIRVVWEEIPEKDQNGIITGYTVFYNETGQSQYFSKNATANQTSASIGGLKPFTKYCIKVAGYTKVGRSPLTDPCYEVETLQKVPSSDPVIVKGQDGTKAEDAHTIRVVWEEIPEKDQNGIITGYTVFYNETGQSQYLSKNATANQTSASIGGLKPFTKYCIKVAGYTKVGRSPLTDPCYEVETLQKVPSSDPVIVKGQDGTKAEDAHTIRVVWEKIPEKDQNGIITGYTVFYNETGQSQYFSKNATASQTSASIGGLKPFTKYCIKVAGYTKVGRSPLTDPCYEVETLQKVPSSDPVIVKGQDGTKAEDAHTIRVVWEKIPEKDQNGIITGYTVFYNETGQSQYFSKNATASQTSASIGGLKPFTKYCIKVAGYTKVGRSPLTDPCYEVETLQKVPSSDPVIVKGQDGTKAEDAHTIRVVWEKIPEKDQNGIITGYTVFYNETGQSQYFSKNATASQTSASIGGLKPFTKYCIRVAGYTKVGRSPLTDPCYEVETLQKVPSSDPVIVKGQDGTKAEDAHTIRVVWEKIPEKDQNGIITGYTVFYNETGQSQYFSKNATASQTSASIGGLKPFTKYCIRVAGYTKVGRSPLTDPCYEVETLQKGPSHPRDVMLQANSSTSILVSWKEPALQNGEITNYMIYYRQQDDQETEAQVTGSTFQRLLTGLRKFTTYYIKVRGKTTQLGNASRLLNATTFEDLPGKPTEVKATLDDGKINVAWEEPFDRNGIILKYQIYCVGKRDYDRAFHHNFNVTADEEVRFAVIEKTNLYPGTEFTVYVTAFTIKGEGNQSKHMVVNTPAVAPPPPTEPQVNYDATTLHTITITIQPASDTNGKVIFHQVIVKILGKVTKRETSTLPDNVTNYKEATRKGENLYMAALLSRDALNTSKVFILGDGKTYGGYENVQLKPGTRYKVYIRGVTEDNGRFLYGESAEISLPHTLSVKTDADDTVGIIAGILGALVLIVIAIIGILLYKRNNRERNPNLDVESHKRKRRDFEFKRLSSKKKVLAVPGEMINDPDHPPIPVEQFAKHVAKLHKSDDRGYMIEYNKLDNGQEYEASTALVPENKPKNRYANIIAYDHSRVALTAIDGIVDSDYINASLIDGYNKPNAYIATQGPVPPTFDDFWRMVWEKQSSTIVMLTNLQERHKLKCHKYWPDEAQDYGDISVMLVKSEHYSDYIIRTFNVKRESEKEEREVKQFHFTVWPDHGVPEYPTALLAFRRRVRAYNPADAGPVVIHCSAGVGRTGTFMVVDSTLDRIKAEKTIDIFNYVAYLRTRRTAMVQTEGQYTFCHDAVLEALQCGNTQIYAHDLRITLARMDVVGQENKVSRFEAEFKILNKVSPVLSKGCYLVASYPENKEKNRSQDILAPDFSRVVLTAIDDNEPTSYINAVNIPGYKQQHAFIVSHHPLTPTVTDFWRMLCEQECSCLVLFDSSEEDGDFPLFWPEDESTYDDMITVRRLSTNSSSVDNLKANYDQAQIAEKMFRATDLRTPETSLRIKMFQYSGWIEEDKIPPCSALITLIAKVEKWQQHSGNGPITVICRDGLGRSGTFCALYSVLERLKIEQVVDVFQAIKAMRIPRPGLVRTAAEYRFIHFAIQEYLSAFDDYANFKP